MYLLIVDFYSHYIEIARLDRPTATEMINHMQNIFARHGIPNVLISDNGPQYTSEAFNDFAKDYKFQYITSSPHYLQGNGEAEQAVGTIQSLLKKGDDPYKALKAYHSISLQLGYSPAQLLMSRVLRSTVPTTEMQRKSRVPNPDL